jgi:N-acylneuraminate cytidylyltransferase
MKKLAIIPARGGSKRIPKKNLKDFLGKPIISYSIKIAIESKLFDEIMVSTDDEDIAEIAIRYGAKVPFFRSVENSDDHATTIDVIEEVLNEYKLRNKIYDYTCCIYPCAPFLSVENLQKSFLKLQVNNYDCVFPIVRYSYPIQRAVRLNHSGSIVMFQPEHIHTRSQDLEASFHDAGQFYFMNTARIIRSRNLWTDNTGYIELSDMESQDIDTIADWKLAEIKYKLMNNL